MVVAQETAAVASTSAPPAGRDAKAIAPVHDVFAGAMARAASQSTIHPLDTYKVRLQAGRNQPPDAGLGPSGRGAVSLGGAAQPRGMQRALGELGSLYKGVFGAASGAGIIIGAYFAVYSTTKRFLRERTTMQDGSIAFVSGATAAVGSSFVKVPIAVCIRSVQAGVYTNVFHAFTSIHRAAGVRGLFTAFVPTLLEDVPDMAVKFAVYETLRQVYSRLHEGRQPGTALDLLMGGLAGAAAAACTTPLDVVKTRMMCSASSRPTITKAVRGVFAEGGKRSFFRGIGPRALSNGLNSAIFFCFFEAIRRGLHTGQQDKDAALAAASAEASLSSPPSPVAAEASSSTSPSGAPTPLSPLTASDSTAAAVAAAVAVSVSEAASTAPPDAPHPHWLRGRRGGARRVGGASSGRMACLSLAIPLGGQRSALRSIGHC